MVKPFLRFAGILPALLVSGIAGAVGCQDEPAGPAVPLTQLEQDIQQIQAYLDDNQLSAESTPSGLHYIIETPGMGGHPTVEDEVTVYYKGYYLDLEVFDETDGSPVTFPLGNVIAGWQEGVARLQKGGKGVLLLPSSLAYGDAPPDGVRSNAVMVFDVELVDF